MWLINVFGVVYFTAVCAQTPQGTTVVYSVQPATSPPPRPTVLSTAYELPVPSLLLQMGWLDAFPSEKVEFKCNITDTSKWTFTWSRNGEEVPASDPNVSLSEDGSTLTITKAAETYNGSYRCKARHKTKGVTTAASSSLQLQVYPNKAKPTMSQSSDFDVMFPGESITFTCILNVSFGWDFVWYHNGSEIQTSTSYTIAYIKQHNSGGYYCKAKRGKDPFYTGPSETTTLLVSDVPKPFLKLLTPWAEMFEDETLEFHCEVNSSDWLFTWYKNQVQLQEEESVLILDPQEPYLNITSITDTHQGGYSCKAEHAFRKVTSDFSNTVNVTVYANTPTPTLSKEPRLNPMYAGERANFTCHVDVSSGWEYYWRKDGNDLAETGKTISVSLDPSNGGKYLCHAIRGESTSTKTSEEITQDVLEIPVPSLKLLTPWLDVFPHESVQMSCGMSDGSDWTYTWYKDDKRVRTEPFFAVDSSGSLFINSTSAVHSGEYSCKGHLNSRSVSSKPSSGLLLTVYDTTPKLTLTRDPDYKVMFPEEAVFFMCHINVSSGWTYEWYREGKSIGHSLNKLTIDPIETVHQGSYKCQAKRGINHVFSTDISKAVQLTVDANRPKPVVTQQPDVENLYVEESLLFQCELQLSTGWEYFWFKDGTKLPIKSSSFSMPSASLSDNGTYDCMAIRSRTMYKTEHSDGRMLYISEIPVPSLTLVTPWLDVFPSERVQMSCGMNGSPDWTYTWYKDGQQVHAYDGVTFFGSSATTLSISSASAAHRGRYSCSGKHTQRAVSTDVSPELTLSVYDTKPTPLLIQNPNHDVMHTGDSVSFVCHINVSSDWEFVWDKGGVELDNSGNNHAVTSVVMENAGSYKCKAKRGTSAVFYSEQSQARTLRIEERPKADITLVTGWSEVFSTDSLVLKCEVPTSKDTWNFTWFREGETIEQPPSKTHTVTPQDDPEQRQYSCQGIRAGRPSYSKRSDQLKTKNLLLKRRVLLSISGCILFGISCVFIGCIILRTIRKPADDEYKPEEADLFLRMDQLKDSDDAPPPAVQYITDSALNASPKEGDEKDVICSESTPLPVTSQDDQALTTESHDAMESNGGMVSFK